MASWLGARAAGAEARGAQREHEEQLGWVRRDADHLVSLAETRAHRLEAALELANSRHERAAAALREEMKGRYAAESALKRSAAESLRERQLLIGALDHVAAVLGSTHDTTGLSLQKEQPATVRNAVRGLNLLGERLSRTATDLRRVLQHPEPISASGAFFGDTMAAAMGDAAEGWREVVQVLSMHLTEAKIKPTPALYHCGTRAEHLSQAVWQERSGSRLYESASHLQAKLAAVQVRNLPTPRA